jgi:nitroimidazol reductase NimA-like FMN-containing flavoprotein (pyridoxamine 5'-phosphate oxidase superfamily)
MLVQELSPKECQDFLAEAVIGRLACTHQNQPYIVPMAVAFEPGRLYSITTWGRKIEWMRENPKVCVQFDQVASRFDWTSVIVYGRFQELVPPRHAEVRERGRKLLEQRELWWQTPMAVGQLDAGDRPLEPIFFAIEIDAVSGLRATP